jgi:prevent-host-death family protein
MRSYTLRELRSHLSEAIRLVSAGEVVAVTKRGREVARILPPTSAASLRKLPSLAEERAAMVANGAKITTSSVVALRDEERA